MALEPGTHLGRYEIVELRGKGGMGEVYRARDPLLDRDVAIKALPSELTRLEHSYAKSPNLTNGRPESAFLSMFVGDAAVGYRLGWLVANRNRPQPAAAASSLHRTRRPSQSRPRQTVAAHGWGIRGMDRKRSLAPLYRPDRLGEKVKDAPRIRDSVDRL